MPRWQAYGLKIDTRFAEHLEKKDPIVTIGYVPASDPSLVVVFSNGRLRYLFMQARDLKLRGATNANWFPKSSRTWTSESHDGIGA